MSIALHFFKRDLRRTWWLFALWTLLFVIEDVLALSSVSPGNSGLMLGPGSGSIFSGLHIFLFPVLRFVALVVLIPQLIQEDVLVGSTAFWLTRPVSRSSLLRAKSMGLALIVLIPAVVYAVVLVVVGLSASDLALAEVQILLGQLFFVVPIALLAALTPSFGRFAAAMAVVLIGFGLLLASSFTIGSTPPTATTFAGAGSAKALIFIEWTFVIIGGGLVLAVQYLTRRTRRCLVLTAALVGAYLLAILVTPRNLGSNRPLPSANATFDPSNVVLQVIPTSLNNVNWRGFSHFTGKNIDGPYHLRGVPPELLVQVRSGDPRLIAPDGTSAKTSGTIPSVPLYQSDPPHTSAIAAALGGIPVYNFQQGDSQTTFVTVDEATFLKYKDSPFKLVDDFDLVVSRYELTAELPLAVGNRYDHGSVHTRIDALVSRADGVTINIAESSVNLLFSSRFHSPGKPTDPRLRGDPVYLLVNRSRKEGALINPLITRMSAFDIHLGGLLTHQFFDLPFGGKGNLREPKIDAVWLAGATLVRLERVPVAEFHKTVETDIPKLGEPWLAFMPKPKAVEPQPK